MRTNVPESTGTGGLEVLRKRMRPRDMVQGGELGGGPGKKSGLAPLRTRCQIFRAWGHREHGEPYSQDFYWELREGFYLGRERGQNLRMVAP